eukprot:4421945-Prymnesium_polylepis.1
MSMIVFSPSAREFASKNSCISLSGFSKSIDLIAAVNCSGGRPKCHAGQSMAHRMGMAQRVHAAQWQGARVLRNGKVRAWSFP